MTPYALEEYSVIALTQRSATALRRTCGLRGDGADYYFGEIHRSSAANATKLTTADQRGSPSII